MLVPFYFLIGMWGGEGRGARDPAVRHLHDGRQPADAGGDPGHGVHRPRHHRPVHLRRSATSPGVQFTETQSTWLFAGFALAFAIKLPLWPFHGWLPGAYRTAPILVTGLLAAVMSKAGVYGLLRIGLPRVPGGRRPLRDPDRGARGDRHRLRVAARLARAHDADAGGLLEPRPPRLHRCWASWRFDVQASQGAVLQMVNHGIVVAAAFAIVGDHQPRGAGRPHRRHRRPRGGRPAAGRRLPDRGDGLAGHPGLELLRGRVPHPHRRLPPAPLARGPRLHRHRLRGRLHAAAVPELDERPAARAARPAAAELRGARPGATCCPWSPRCWSSPSGRTAIVGDHHGDARARRSRRPRWPRAARPTRSTRSRPPTRRPYALPLPGDAAAGAAAAAADDGGDAVSDMNVVAATPLIITAGTATWRCGVGLLPGRTPRRHGPAAVGIAGIVARDRDVRRALGRPPGGLRRRPARRPLQPAAERPLPRRPPCSRSCWRGASPPRWTGGASSWA